MFHYMCAFTCHDTLENDTCMSIQIYVLTYNIYDIRRNKINYYFTCIVQAGKLQREQLVYIMHSTWKELYYLVKNVSYKNIYKYIYINIYGVSHFQSCIEIFLQRSIFRKNV